MYGNTNRLNGYEKTPPLSHIDPSMLTLGQFDIKEDDILEPMTTDFDMTVLANVQDGSLLSPLSTSPLDQDFNAVGDRSSRSLNGSPFGTPGLQSTNGYYSMSLPAHTNQYETQNFPATFNAGFQGRPPAPENTEDNSRLSYILFDIVLML